ncbi:hypothetical protein R3P38DRAFT_2960362 [Favolaschia claudopus]|uniref:Uncharacterized protein n=1 Tax=Favolaschia claudopus TaxID=2862362 RepID=A0AAW0B953_9AGAR
MLSFASSGSISLKFILAAFLPVVWALGKRDAISDSGLSSANWIWLPEPDLLTTAPIGNVAFVKTLTSPTGKTAVRASIAITADNNFTLWCNAQPIGATDGTSAGQGWQNIQALSSALNASANVLSVLAGNSAVGSLADANPAGLLAAIRVFYSDGSNETVLSDNTWLVSGTIPKDFPVPLDLSSFTQAQIATKFGSGPWGTGLQFPAADTLNLTGSAWLWNSNNAATSAPAGSVGFRKTVVSPSDKTASSATVVLTADNTFQLLVNGQYIGAPFVDTNVLGSAESWQYAQRFTVALTSSKNTFNVIATNFPGQNSDPNSLSSAGLIAAIRITYSDGSSSILRTDTSWLAGSTTSAASFLAAADSSLKAAVSQGQYGIGPWTQVMTVDALNALKLPAINGVVATPSGSAGSGTLKAPTSTFSDPSSQNTDPSQSPPPGTTGGACGTVDARLLPLLVLTLASMAFCLL